MKIALFILSLFTLISFANAQAFTQSTDLLLQKSLTLKTNQLDVVMKKTEENIKAFVDNFDVKLDSGSNITSPKTVNGTLLQPVLKVSIRKCVFFFCQTIDLDAEFTLQTVNGSCAYNYLLSVDLQRSSQMLTDLYSHINTDICISKTETGAQANLVVNLVRALNYSGGIVQKQAYSLISLQGQSILESFTEVMKLNGVEQVF